MNTEIKSTNEAKDLSKDETQEKLKEWLKNQPIILQNGFFILTIMDMIDGIRKQCQKVGTGSVKNFQDFVDMTNDIL